MSIARSTNALKRSFISIMDERFDTAPCGFLSLTDDGLIELINGTLLNLLEWPPDELQGKKVEAILPIASRIFYQTHLFPLLKMKGHIEEIYLSLRSKSGKDVPVLVNGLRREIEGCVINDFIVVPIHQRIQYEEEILKAKKTAELAVLAQNHAEKALMLQYEKALLLRQITQNIRHSLHLSEIFEIAVHDIRQFIEVDRVGIFQFHSTQALGEGVFVAESVAEGYDALMTAQDQHLCFGQYYLRKSPNYAILAEANLSNSELTAADNTVFEAFQIQAYLVAPLLKEDSLWGLLCIHQCSDSRHWQQLELDLVQEIASQLTIAIRQADLFEQLQAELAEKKRTEIRLIQINEELARTTQLLEKLVETDGLTQIANRRCFDRRLDQEWTRLTRDQKPLSIVLFDVDYFKRYNDTYGHQLGDQCLVTLAQTAQQIVGRAADLLARYGGEEFVVILPNTPIAGAMAVAERIRQAVQALNLPHQASDVAPCVTLSIGVSTLVPSEQASPGMLVHQADQALYRAKQHGRNRVEWRMA